MIKAAMTPIINTPKGTPMPMAIFVTSLDELDCGCGSVFAALEVVVAELGTGRVCERNPTVAEAVVDCTSAVVSLMRVKAEVPAWKMTRFVLLPQWQSSSPSQQYV